MTRLWLLLALLGIAVAGAYATTRMGRGAPPSSDWFTGVPPNPGTYPDFDWTGTLRRALEGADRLEIQPVQEFTTDEDGEPVEVPPPRIVEGSGHLKDLIDGLEVDPADSGGLCACGGWLWLRFSRAGNAIGSLLLKHEGRLFWAGAPPWPGEANLRDESAEKLARWLDSAGCPELLAKRREMDRKHAFEQEIKAQFPVAARERLFAQSRERTGDAVRLCGGPVEFTVRACRALGLSKEPWISGDYLVRCIEEGLRLVDGDAFARALPRIEHDPVAMKGAARLAFGNRWIEKLRAADRGPWAAKLGSFVLAQGDPDTCDTTLRRLGGITHPDVAAVLARCSRVDVVRDRSSDDRYQDPGLRASALLQRARQRDPEVRAEIEALLPTTLDGPDKSALEVGLAFLGEASRLHIEQFQFRSYTLGFMGIEAIERFEGREGLGVLVQVIEVHPFGEVNGEAAESFVRLTGFVPTRGGSGPRKAARDQMVEWWMANGAAFEAKKRAERK